MKTKIIIAAFIMAVTSISAQTNLLLDGGFETPAKNYVINNSGANKFSNNGKWFISFSLGGCENGCCEGTSEFTTVEKKSGNSSLKIDVVRQKNRNDIRLFQTIKGVSAGIYEVSFWTKSDKEGYPIAIDILKGTQPGTNNGVEPFTGNFTTSTQWKQFKFNVDLSGWLPEELELMRVSIRPNNNKKLPEGPYPKTFWVDEVSFVAVK
jgi:hypothetical protein